MKYLFDLDDTLVRSSDIVFRSMQEWCAKNSIDLDLAFEIGKGRRTEDTVSLLAPHLNAQLEAHWIEERESALVGSIQPVGGAVEFVTQLAKSSWGIVTSSSHELALKKLNVCNFPIPQILVSADSVASGKPSPEPYTKAIELLRATPSACIAFEDAESGVESALAAGCQVIIVGDSGSQFDAEIAGRISSFNQLRISESGLRITECQHT